MEVVLVVATESIAGPVWLDSLSPTLAEDEAISEDGEPGCVGGLEEDEGVGWVGVSVEEEKGWGRGAMEASGCWTTKRLGWRKPMGWAGKSAVAMPVAVAGGAAGSSGWGTRGWRRPQK